MGALTRGTGNRPVAFDARCPHCGGGIPWDCDGDLSTACACGLDWAQSAPFPKSTLTGPEWDVVRALLLLRCGGRCEVTGDALHTGRWSVHHRRPRGMGGTDRPDVHSLANLLAVTGDGTRGVHGWIESNRDDARALGWLVDRTAVRDVTDTPVVLYSGRRVLLAPTQGAYLDAPGAPYHLGPMPKIRAA
jgi:hypothetical protein